MESILGKTYKTNNHGDLLVLSPIKRGKYTYYNCKFIKTGTIVQASKANITRGFVKDYKNIHADVVGKVFCSNKFGLFYVERAVKAPKGHDVEITFFKTGHKKVVTKNNVLTGEVRDPYYPIKYGVACMGKGNKQSIFYTRWCCMISRCYNQNDVAYHRYGGLGITVCDRWLCFENFIKDAVLLNGYSNQGITSGKLQLDKDKNGGGVYSPENCEWLTCKENQKYRKPRHSLKPYVKNRR